MSLAKKGYESIRTGIEVKDKNTHQNKPHTKSFQTHPLQIFIQFLLNNRRPFQILPISPLIHIFLGHLKRRFKNIHRVQRRTHQHLEIHGVVAHLLDFLLALVQKHQLVWDLGIGVLVLHRHVPD